MEFILVSEAADRGGNLHEEDILEVIMAFVNRVDHNPTYNERVKEIALSHQAGTAAFLKNLLQAET